MTPADVILHWLSLGLLIAQMCGFTSSTSATHVVNSTTTTHVVADQFGLPFLLAAVRQEVQALASTRPCQLTFSVDELAEAFYDDLLRDPELLEQYRFHMDHRQYANELLLLEYFRSSPCRIRDGGGDGITHSSSSSSSSSKEKVINVLSSKQVPHYYIIFIPFKSLLSGLNSNSRPDHHQRNSRLSAILHRVFTSKTFLYDREHYLYVYTATFHFDHHFISHLHKDFHKLLDHRVVRLGEVMMIDRWMDGLMYR